MNKILLVIALLLIATAQAGVIKDDFLVNDDTTNAAYRTYPLVGMDSSGNFVVTWKDDKIPGNYFFGKKYDWLGNPIGEEFRVSDDSIINGYYNLEMNIAMNAAGRFVVSWGIIRPGGSTYAPADIYVRIFDSDANPVGPTQVVNVNPTRHEHGIAMNNNGNFVIAWTDSGKNGGDCYARRYDSNGNPLGPPILIKPITTPPPNPDHIGPRDPKVAIDKNGNFVVCWEDQHTYGNWDIWAQRVDSTGNLVDTMFIINSDATAGNQWGSRIAMEPDGKFAVVWGPVRLFNADGSPLTPTTAFNDSGGGTTRIAMNKLGYTITWWRPHVTLGWAILIQQFDSLGAEVGPNIRVNDEWAYMRGYPWIAKSKGLSQKTVVVWHDSRPTPFRNSKIFAQRYDGNSPQGPNVNLTPEQGTTDQFMPSIAMDINGRAVAVWIDMRLQPNERVIAGQRLDSLGNLIGANFRVDEDGVPDDPMVAFGGNGNFIVVWRQPTVNFSPDILGQLFNFESGMIDTIFKVNTWEPAPYMISQLVPAVAMNKKGAFNVVWYDRRELNIETGIYCQRYDSMGVVIGTNFAISDTNDYSWRANNPGVVMDSLGNFIVVWQDKRNGNFDIFCRRFDPNGTPQGLSFKVNDDIGSNPQCTPWITMEDGGKSVIIWKDYRNSEWEIYGQSYDSIGNPISTNFKVSDASAVIVFTPGDTIRGEVYAPRPPSAAMETNGKFIVSWDDNREGNGDIYAQIYNPDASPNGGNFRVNNLISGTNPSQWSQSVSANSTQIAFAWTDAKRDKGWDIYAKLLDWTIVGTRETEKITQVPVVNLLYYTSPNPFTSATQISYAIAKKSAVNLAVYNVLGQQIKTLVSENREPGSYEMTWDATDNKGRKLSAGIYFVQLENGDFKQVEKVILLR